MPRKYMMKTTGNNNLEYFNWNTLSNCLQTAKNQNVKYMGFTPYSKLTSGGWQQSNDDYDNMYGWCYKSNNNYNPLDDPGANNGNMELYAVPSTCPVINDSNVATCVQNNASAVIVSEINDLKQRILDTNQRILNAKIRKYALDNNLTLEVARTRYLELVQQEENEKVSQQSRTEIDLQNRQLSILNNASRNANLDHVFN